MLNGSPGYHSAFEQRDEQALAETSSRFGALARALVKNITGSTEDSALIRSGTFQPDGGLLLFVSRQPPFTPEIRSTRHFLIAVPKLCHVDEARVTAIFEMENTEEQYRRAESEPFTFSGYISTD